MFVWFVPELHREMTTVHKGCEIINFGADFYL